MNKSLAHIKDSILNSYSQVFFSDNPYFALLLLIASFTDPLVGASGLLSVLISVLGAMAFGLNPAHVRHGIFSFNSLLTGFAVGAYFQLNLALLVVASLLTLLFTTWISAITARHRLPFLSLPFIIASWILFLNSGLLHAPAFAPRHLPGTVPGYLSCLQALPATSFITESVLLYFKSLSAVFFQSNAVAGILIAAGLLIYSRIAFFLSVLGFVTGFLYFSYFEGNTVRDQYYFTAFNYMLTYIGIGGFFLLPSKGSYLLALIVTPVIGLLSAALSAALFSWHLPVYSLPFSVVTILVISALNSRSGFKYFHLVPYQLYSPEKNLYASYSYAERFKNEPLVQVHLPFFGEWTVSQGYEGNLTHKREWRYAWDFVVADEHRRTFRLPGKKTSDFYCYALPVLAPADGLVVKVENGIEDNAVGEVNLSENWGNTLIIKHAEQVYSQLSHLKKDSFKVKEGDAVKKGELLALCGSSGRSPEPHIHFQLQDTPNVGAQTIKHPLGLYLLRRGEAYHLHTFDEPKENELVLKPVPSLLLKQSFYFIPGKRLSFEVSGKGPAYRVSWEVITDELNNSYLLCTRTQSKAYFVTNDTLFYFTAFTGDKHSLLYYFYLGAYKLLLSYYPNLVIEDKLPVEGTYTGIRKWVQDALAPFYIYLKPVYKTTYEEANDKHHPTQLKVTSEIFSMGTEGKRTRIDIRLADTKIHDITIRENDTCITAKHIQ